MKFHRLRLISTVVSLLACCGCAAITNPVANGIPARLLPDELLAEAKEPLEPIPWTWLRRRPEDYRLDAGDILGVYIVGVLGNEDQLPPINFPDVADKPPSLGFPIPIQEDGTLPLPLIEPVHVSGLSVEQARRKIIKAYTVDKEILQPDEAKVLLTLISGRKARIQVIREDSPQGNSFVPGYGLAGLRGVLQDRGQGTGSVLELPVSESDVLNVLTRTGGLPGPNADNEVIILRGYSGEVMSDQLAAVRKSTGDSMPQAETIRIPLRLPQGALQPFSPESVMLKSGDIVYIPALDAQVYYTGGILPAREVPLPRDYDIDVVEALLRGGGPLISGAINTGNFNGSLLGTALGNPNPSLLTVLRRTGDGRQVTIRVDLNRAVRDPRENLLVQAGDVLILQETPAEAVARYFSRIINLNFFGRVLDQSDATATFGASLPQ